MKFKAAFFIIILSLSANSFGSDSTHKEMIKRERKSLTDKVKAKMIKVLEANESLHSSFFNYDGKKVEESAANLKIAIENLKDPELSKLLAFSKSKLSSIKAANERKDNNQNYHLVSSALIYIVNKYDVGKKYNAYSCPMVKKKWVQNSEKLAKIHNPYAPDMPHCGSMDSHH